MRVLVVDDDLLMLTGLRKTLQKQGYDVKVADEGKLALQIANRFRPHVVFVDYCLGPENGIDVIVQLRQLLPDADLILITNYPLTNELSDNAFVEGADWILQKQEIVLLFSVFARIEVDHDSHAEHRESKVVSPLLRAVLPRRLHQVLGRYEVGSSTSLSELSQMLAKPR